MFATREKTFFQLGRAKWVLTCHVPKTPSDINVLTAKPTKKEEEEEKGKNAASGACEYIMQNRWPCEHCKNHTSTASCESFGDVKKHNLLQW
jgi:hypothetical protein